MRTFALYNSPIKGTLASVVVLSLAASASALAAKEGFEKCEGVVKAGMNDCGTNGHSCAGQSKKL